jgi:hypothetical protein
VQDATCQAAPAHLCGIGCLKNACGKKPLGFGRTIATVALAIPAWTICTFSLKHLPQTRRCQIGEQGEHDEQIRIFIGNFFAGISGSVYINHLWPVVAGGGVMKDEALKLALEALEKSVATCFDRYSHEQVMSRPEHFINQAITAIKQALAAPVQEPVAWFYRAAAPKKGQP